MRMLPGKRLPWRLERFSENEPVGSDRVSNVVADEHQKALYRIRIIGEEF